MSDNNWNNRFSPLQKEEEEDYEFLEDTSDLNEERKKFINKYKLTKEDKKIIKEQKETAKDMEQFRKKECQDFGFRKSR